MYIVTTHIMIQHRHMPVISRIRHTNDQRVHKMCFCFLFSDECVLTRNTAAELVGEFRDQVVVDTIFQRTENDNGTCVLHWQCVNNNTWNDHNIFVQIPNSQSLPCCKHNWSWKTSDMNNDICHLLAQIMLHGWITLFRNRFVAGK